MFLRWSRHPDKAGRTLLYGRLVSSERVGGKVRHRNGGSLRVVIQAGIDLSAAERGLAWSHFDAVLCRQRLSLRERANIARAFGLVVGTRP